MGLISVVFEENSQLKTIGSYAFSDSESLSSITIPSTVTSIGAKAFAGCSGLTNVIFEDTDNWFVCDSADATSGIKISAIPSVKRFLK
jgi:hypothetical protein